MADSPSILPNVSIAGLNALANSALAPQAQSRLQILLSRNAEGSLSEAELNELESFIEQIDELNLLKARAEFTLRQLGGQQAP